MNRFVWVLAILAALALARPALADQGGERYVMHTYRSSFSGFRYRPFSFQIEGGPTFSEGGMARQDLTGGYNLGLGLTWRPTSRLPLALRIDGMYEHFDDRPAVLARAGSTFGAIGWGRTELWGGDVDLELDTLLSPRVRLYFLLGGGYYDRRDSFYRSGLVNGIFCGWYFCFEGPVEMGLRVGDQTTGMRFEKNAGVGLEFALSRTTSFFVDARYMRFTQGGQNLDFVPLRFGLRF